MIIDAPRADDLFLLQNLWKEAFGDSEIFWRDFISAVRPGERCRCLWQEGKLAAALYWFDCYWEDRPIAYLYGVATAKAFQGRGLCRALMEDTHEYLKELGYYGAILVPGGPELFKMYEKMGYRTAFHVREFDSRAGEPISLRQLDADEYAQLRRKYLPGGGVVQEGQTLRLLEKQCKFYTGQDCLLVCGVENGVLSVGELLGEEKAAPGILGALGYQMGRFRMPGKGRAFGMYHALTDDSAVPAYFGLAMD